MVLCSTASWTRRAVLILVCFCFIWLPVSRKLHGTPRVTHHKPPTVEGQPVKDIRPMGLGFQQSKDTGSSSIWLYPKGDFFARLETYLRMIERVRHTLLKVGKTVGGWQKPRGGKLVLINGLDGRYLERLARHEFVQTVFLGWDKSTGSRDAWSSMNDTTNVLVSKYYQWICDDALRSWISQANATKHHYDVQFRRRCETNMDRAQTPISLELDYFHYSGYNTSSIVPEPPLPTYVFYCHVIPDAIVTNFGYIISRYLKIVPLQCQSDDFSPHPPRGYQTRPLYDEVLVISQFWGEGYYHRNMEMLPRISPYVELLRRHPNINIHALDLNGRTTEMVRLLGLDNQVIFGDIRARLVYLPQSTDCGGMRQVQGTQLLAHHYRRHVARTHGQKTTDALVLIKRTYRRRLLYHDQIKARLESVAREFRLEFRHFDDTDLPNVTETVRIFNKAALVVGPHGAGLSNVLFSNPGTYVVEALCDQPHVLLCFQMAAHILGHHYHGIPSRARKGCMRYIEVDPERVEKVVRYYLKQRESTLQFTE